MNTTPAKKRAPASKEKKSSKALRLGTDSSDVLQKLKDKANKKDFGKRIRVDQIVRLGLSLIEPKHLEDLQRSSVSNEDRVKALLRTYVEKRKSMTREEFWGLMLAGKPPIDEQNVG